MTKVDWSGLDVCTNYIYKPLYANWDRFNVIFGGSGSGKSMFIAQRFVFRLLTVAGYNLLITRKFAVTNRFSTFALMNQVISQWNMEGLFTVNKTDMTITAPNGNQALFLGLDSQDKIKSITFKTGILQAVWMEEANEFEQDDLTQLDLRLRGMSEVPFQITVSFNPVSSFHWLKQYFIDVHIKGCTIVKTTYLDNRFIDEAYKERLNSLTGTARQVYALGEWGVTEGLVFKSFSQSDIPENAKRYGYGLDFGFSSDPAALIDVWTRGEEVYLDEKIYQTNLTNSDLSGLMRGREVSSTAFIVADSSEPKSIEDLHRAGWNIHAAKKGPDSIRFGLDFMLGKKIFITPQSRNLIKEFYAYTWKADKNGKFLPEPIDAFNHGIDAARYLLMHMAKDNHKEPVRAKPLPTVSKWS